MDAAGAAPVVLCLQKILARLGRRVSDRTGWSTGPCCAVLCCAVLCCAVLCSMEGRPAGPGEWGDSRLEAHHPVLPPSSSGQREPVV